ncbi:hypothetical protein M2397_004746 [Pseudomonas sp. BIGb0381]|uniref:hypothetical protein n=1 Tax=Pseudomonas sp. BIGb0381 TaxID=2940608 RepID=UPI0021691700|nr:hypothetical protein [Pseudomonas sp. BIGb0381]MCS4314426.1 hypothetical protein [Pseudomonas sp. BIGb0381]
MSHPKLISAVLASLQLNQMMIGEAFEEIAMWLDKEGETASSPQSIPLLGN